MALREWPSRCIPEPRSPRDYVSASSRFAPSSSSGSAPCLLGCFLRLEEGRKDEEESLRSKRELASSTRIRQIPLPSVPFAFTRRFLVALDGEGGWEGGRGIMMKHV